MGDRSDSPLPDLGAIKLNQKALLLVMKLQAHVKGRRVRKAYEARRRQIEFKAHERMRDDTIALDDVASPGSFSGFGDKIWQQKRGHALSQEKSNMLENSISDNHMADVGPFGGHSKQKLIALIVAEQKRQKAIKDDNDRLEKLVYPICVAKQGDMTDDISSSAMQNKKALYTQSMLELKKEQTLKQYRYDELEGDRGEFERVYDGKAQHTDATQHKFSQFTRQIANQAENTRTSKPIAKKMLDSFFDEEWNMDLKLQGERLEQIKLMHRIADTEAAVKKNDDLGEKTPIDFEQRKIENQSLNEKIEERNEELQKLKRKTTSTVQVLTHVKEKMQYVQAQCEQEREDLRKLQLDVGSRLDKLSQLKKERTRLRADNTVAIQDQSFANNETLIRDFELRKRAVVNTNHTMHALGDKSKQLGKDVRYLKRMEEPQLPADQVWSLHGM